MSARLGPWTAAVYLALAYVFVMLPVAALVLFSFQGSTLPVPPFDGPSLRWYQDVLGNAKLMAGLRNSALVGLVSSLVAVLLGFLAAYGLARHRVPGAPFLRWILILPLTISYLVIGMGLLLTFNALGLGKSLWAVGIGHVVINLPLCFAILAGQMGEEQATLERAARDLGAAEWQVLTLVTAPVLFPAVFAAFFLSFTLSWDEFVIAFLLSRFETTLPVEIWSLLRSGLNPRTNAIGSLVFLVSVVLVLLAELVLFRKRRA